MKSKYVGLEITLMLIHDDVVTASVFIEGNDVINNDGEWQGFTLNG